MSAVGRLVDPRPLSDVGVGLAVSVGASAINLVVARTLIAAGREHRSLVLEADGRHLMTDVWTSAGVVAGVALVAITGWERLDARGDRRRAGAPRARRRGVPRAAHPPGGPRAFVSVHVLVPGDWTVQRGHDLVDRVEDEQRTAVRPATARTQLEPLEDPASFADTALDRRARADAP